MITQHLPLVLVTLALGISLLMLQRQVSALREQVEVVTTALKQQHAKPPRPSPQPPAIVQRQERPAVPIVEELDSEFPPPAKPSKSILKRPSKDESHNTDSSA
jgi:hypothetical protein